MPSNILLVTVVSANHFIFHVNIEIILYLAKSSKNESYYLIYWDDIDTGHEHRLDGNSQFLQNPCILQETHKSFDMCSLSVHHMLKTISWSAVIHTVYSSLGHAVEIHTSQLLNIGSQYELAVPSEQRLYSAGRMSSGT